MTAQTLKRQSKHKASQGDSPINREDCSILSKQIKLFFIATKMKKSGLSDFFIVNAVRVALEFKGVSDLMSIWAEEKDANEKEEVIADIQDMIDACERKDKQEEMYIKFNDLDAISKNIRAFKDTLLQKVMKQGGISKLSGLTGIPQSSLSRFFNSDAMPRRSTVLAIAKALELDGLELDMKWSK
jgi:DNA-binding phage protein